MANKAAMNCFVDQVISLLTEDDVLPKDALQGMLENIEDLNKQDNILAYPLQLKLLNEGSTHEGWDTLLFVFKCPKQHSTMLSYKYSSGKLSEVCETEVTKCHNDEEESSEVIHDFGIVDVSDSLDKKNQNDNNDKAASEIIVSSDPEFKNHAACDDDAKVITNEGDKIAELHEAISCCNQTNVNEFRNQDDGSETDNMGISARTMKSNEGEQESEINMAEIDHHDQPDESKTNEIQQAERCKDGDKNLEEKSAFSSDLNGEVEQKKHENTKPTDSPEKTPGEEWWMKKNKRKSVLKKNEKLFFDKPSRNVKSKNETDNEKLEDKSGSMESDVNVSLSKDDTEVYLETMSAVGSDDAKETNNGSQMFETTGSLIYDRNEDSSGLPNDEDIGKAKETSFDQNEGSSELPNDEYFSKTKETINLKAMKRPNDSTTEEEHTMYPEQVNSFCKDAPDEGDDIPSESSTTQKFRKSFRKTSLGTLFLDTIEEQELKMADPSDLDISFLQNVTTSLSEGEVFSEESYCELKTNKLPAKGQHFIISELNEIVFDNSKTTTLEDKALFNSESTEAYETNYIGVQEDILDVTDEASVIKELIKASSTFTKQNIRITSESTEITAVEEDSTAMKNKSSKKFESPPTTTIKQNEGNTSELPRHDSNEIKNLIIGDALLNDESLSVKYEATRKILTGENLLDTATIGISDDTPNKISISSDTELRQSNESNSSDDRCTDFYSFEDRDVEYSSEIRKHRSNQPTPSTLSSQPVVDKHLYKGDERRRGKHEIDSTTDMDIIAIIRQMKLKAGRVINKQQKLDMKMKVLKKMDYTS